MQQDCTGQDMELMSSLRSSEDYTAVSGSGSAVVIGHNSEDCTSAATDAGSRAKKQRRSLEARQYCCSGILLATAGQVLHIAAGRM